MAWTGQTFTVGQILTAAQMNNLQADITALANGDVGSPSIVQAAIGAAAVGQNELKSGIGTVSTALTAGAILTLPGGEYGNYPQLKSSNALGFCSWGYRYSTGTGLYAGSVQGTAYDTSIFISTSNASYTATAQQRYIQASPPYFDAGGDLIGRYIFAEIDKASGKVVSVYSATEAPWHYNGPTDIRGKLMANGKKYRERKDMSFMPFTHAQAKTDPMKLQEYYAAFGEAPSILEEITQSIKDADMHLIPRPMKPTATTVVVMLDPISDLNHQLCEMCCHDEFSINELLHGGLITVDGEPLTRAGPPGVPVHGFRWK